MSVPKIGRYEVEDELGTGGMAVVYLARDPYMQRQVAVKVLAYQLTSDALYQEYFQREAEVIAALEHPCIVPVFDFGRHGNQPYIVMRYMAGGSLQDRLNKGELKARDMAHIVGRVAEGLDAAHARGIVIATSNRQISNPPRRQAVQHSLQRFGRGLSVRFRPGQVVEPLKRHDGGHVRRGTPEYIEPGAGA